MSQGSINYYISIIFWLNTKVVKGRKMRLAQGNFEFRVATQLVLSKETSKAWKNLFLTYNVAFHNSPFQWYAPMPELKLTSFNLGLKDAAHLDQSLN